jgi:hypothetical protein
LTRRPKARSRPARPGRDGDATRSGDEGRTYYRLSLEVKEVPKEGAGGRTARLAVIHCVGDRAIHSHTYCGHSVRVPGWGRPFLVHPARCPLPDCRCGGRGSRYMRRCGRFRPGMIFFSCVRLRASTTPEVRVYFRSKKVVKLTVGFFRQLMRPLHQLGACLAPTVADTLAYIGFLRRFSEGTSSRIPSTGY